MGRTRQRRLMAGVFAVLILAFHPLSVSAQSQQELKAVQRDLEQSKARAEELKQKAERAASESKGVSGRLVAKAAEIQNLESTIAALDAEIGELAGKAAAKKTAIIAENRNLGVMLAALARLSQHPPEILLLKPEEAAATVRTASLLSLTLPAIQDKAKSLKNDLGELTELRNGILSAREEQRQALAALRTEEAALKRLQAEKQTLYRDLSANLQS
ncbi:MAG TPA: hypothetical protein VD713_00250, partial [Sphingomonadales bacterium]|nr:hypothetical protein [Sphingomonadales bacterium]